MRAAATVASFISAGSQGAARPILPPRYSGVFPVAPTVFDAEGRLDLDGQKRGIDFKIEVPQAANKLRALIEAGGECIVGPWDGEEAITLLADLDAGATGAMTGGGFPDGIREIIAP